MPFIEPGERFLKFSDIEKFLRGNGFITSGLDSGRAWCGSWRNLIIRFNPTTMPGKGITALMSLAAQMQNRLDFSVHRIDDWIDISPSHPDYQTIVRQKQDIIRQIKESLAQVDRAISDVELLEHDERKYREILQYFKEEDEHSLKAMFIDQVDAYTGEGISMRSIAPRWPTIIADFQMLDPKEDVTVERAQEKVKVSKAEAVILTTKIKLYNKWKDFFRETVKNRYQRIMERIAARRRSIEEYKEWARPLIRRAQQMREVDTHFLATNYFLPIATGTPISVQGVEYWAWTRVKGLEAVEMHRAPREIYESEAGEPPRFTVEPYDDVVKALIPLVEKKHGMKVTPDIILEARKRFAGEKWGAPGALWYIFIRIPTVIARVRMPDGSEFEDVDYNEIQGWSITQNILLVKIIEIILEEKKFDTYINELLGKEMLETAETEVEGEKFKIKSPVDIDKVLRKDFPEFYGEAEKPEEEKKGLFESISEPFKKMDEWTRKVFGIRLAFFKRGQYDPDYKDSISYRYGREFFRMIWLPDIFGFLKNKFGAI